MKNNKLIVKNARENSTDLRLVKFEGQLFDKKISVNKVGFIKAIKHKAPGKVVYGLGSSKILSEIVYTLYMLLYEAGGNDIGIGFNTLNIIKDIGLPDLMRLLLKHSNLPKMYLDRTSELKDEMNE